MPAIELAVVIAVIALLAAGCVHPAVAPGPKSGPITLAVNGQTDYVIVLAADRSLSEQHAAAELSRFLKEVTGAEFAIVAPQERGKRPAIAVGPGAARRLIPGLDLTNLGQDGIVIQSCAPHLVLTGGPGASRGTLYAMAGIPNNWMRRAGAGSNIAATTTVGDLCIRLTHWSPRTNFFPSIRNGLVKLMANGWGNLKSSGV